MRTSTATLRPGAEQVVTIRPLIPGRVLSDAERETVAAHERTFLAQPYGGMRERAARATDARHAAARAIRVADPRKVRGPAADDDCNVTFTDETGVTTRHRAGSSDLADVQSMHPDGITRPL